MQQAVPHTSTKLQNSAPATHQPPAAPPASRRGPRRPSPGGVARESPGVNWVSRSVLLARFLATIPAGMGVVRGGQRFDSEKQAQRQGWCRLCKRLPTTPHCSQRVVRPACHIPISVSPVLEKRSAMPHIFIYHICTPPPPRAPTLKSGSPFLSSAWVRPASGSWSLRGQCG